jgi:DNA-binding GntR family transcriptional regulator
MIVTLELRPGTVLVEKELCARFSVSRTPVREAVLRLAEHGLVTIAPQHATYVSRIDPAAVRQAHFLRSNLEVPIVRRLCDASNLDLSPVRAVLMEQQLVMNRADYAEFMPLDDQFHQALFALAGMEELWSVIHARKAHLDRIRFLQSPDAGRIPRLVREHSGILEAIEFGKFEVAEQAVRSHIAGSALYLEELVLMNSDLVYHSR